MPPRKKKTPPKEIVYLNEPREVHEFGLADVLASFGRDRLAIKTLLNGLGIHDATTAFNFLRNQDRIPALMTASQFEKIYQELMA